MQNIELIKNYEDETGSPIWDSLSGLLNHGFFQMVLDHETKRSQRHGDSLSLAMIDIDGFKFYNRRQGVAQGDRTIRAIADIIKRRIRDIDLASRYGGDLFCVLLLNTDSESANAPMERIRQAVEDLDGGRLSVSIGVAEYTDEDKDWHDLLTHARDALKAAKLGGKNRIRSFQKNIVDKDIDSACVLVVDDDARNVKLIEALLRSQDYEVLKAYSGEEALDLVQKASIDVVLLDIMMPVMDGYEVCRRLKANELTRMLPVVMVTALDDLNDKVTAIEAGADDFLTKPVNRLELLARTRSLVKYKRLNHKFVSLENILFSLANAVEAKDVYTQGHVERVANLAMALGRKLQLSESDLESLKYGGALHDIGKIKVPRDVLNKPGKLSADEWGIMQDHAAAGYDICLPLKKNLGPALNVIRHHHEKLDGSGYPDGLKSDEINMPNRIMAVVDIYDALTTDRPYRSKMPTDKAISILREEATGGKLDTEVVEALIEMLK